MGLLKVNNLHKEFKNVKAVNGINFKVKEGEVFGLLGPNGAGKSTTISMISSLIKPTEGEIYYKEKNIIKEPKYIQKRLGVVPQEIALYPTLSGYENLRFWGNVYGVKGNHLKKRIEEVASIIGIKDRLKDKVENYSGGMKRRINIGSALLHEPELLIMDEPTVGIDPQSRNHILDTVLELNKQGMTIIYTSHYMEEVEYLCSRISILDKGEVIASGTKEELIDMINEENRINLKLSTMDEDLLNKIREITHVKQADIIEDIIVISTEEDEAIFKDIIDTVSKTESSILSIDVKKPNLESVFLHLTGRALRD